MTEVVFDMREGRKPKQKFTYTSKYMRVAYVTRIAEPLSRHPPAKVNKQGRTIVEGVQVNINI
jgi:hypothetical protein